MTEKPLDFRDQAATASLEILGGNPLRSSIASKASVCVPAVAARNAYQKRAAIFDLMMILLGILLAFCGPGFAALTKIYALIALLPVGFLLVISHQSLRQQRTRSYLSRSDDLLFDPRDPDACAVEIEDPATYEKLKLITEDFGMFFADVRSQTIFIEGMQYRYVIRAADIVNVTSAESIGESGITLGYRIGQTELSLVIKYHGNGPIQTILNSFNSRLGAMRLLAKIDPLLSASKSQPPPL